VRFGFRDYDPEVGRWTAKDPIGINSGYFDHFLYCGYDPINLIDVNGLLFLDFLVSKGTINVYNDDLKFKYSLPATAGDGACMNNPDCADQNDKGPIPSGLYEIIPSELNDLSVLKTIKRLISGDGDWGDFSVPIHKSPGSQCVVGCDRGGFYIHGGVKIGSAGCIDIGGGISGDATTNRLKNDIKNSKSNIYLFVR